MCGIAGILRKDLEFEVTENDIINMLIMLESRGKDATGIAWEDNKRYRVLKAAVRVNDFIDLEVFKKNLPEMVKSKTILFHTRAATNGSPKFNGNNHPIHNDKGMIIHNGVVYPSEVLPAKGVTDSEQLMLSVQKYGFKEGISKLCGSMAFSYIDFTDGAVYLYSEISPICYYIEKGTLIFASTNLILAKGLGLPSKNIRRMEENIVYKIENYQLKRIIKARGATRYETIYKADYDYDLCNYQSILRRLPYSY